jgi:hypothetical protein
MDAVVVAGRREQVGAFFASARVAEWDGSAHSGDGRTSQLLRGCERRAAGLRCRGKAGPARLARRHQPDFITAVAPTPVPSMAGVRDRTVVCHEHCNLALSEAGQVFAWGRVQSSQEEDIAGREWHAPVPTVMEELRHHRVRQVVAGCCHCAALTEGGALFT